MSYTATLQQSSTLSLPADTYIYSLAHLTLSTACISSDDSLSVFDVGPHGLTLLHRAPACHTGVTCLASSANKRHALTAGRDGMVKLWDAQRGGNGPVLMFGGSDTAQGFSALAASSHLIAAGTENTRDGPGNVSIHIFDARSPSKPLRTYTESHNDTVTVLRFSSDDPSILLSGSTDGLLTLINTSVTDEDDAVHQVFNHGAAVHCATFLDRDEVAAVSSDEQLGVYRVSSAAEIKAAEGEGTEAQAGTGEETRYGDVREQLGANYVVDFVMGHDRMFVASGNLESKIFSFMSLKKPEGRKSTEYVFDAGQWVKFPGAHGGEVVRDVLLPKNRYNGILTCGEDGTVRLWTVPESSRAAQGDAGADVEMDEMDVEGQGGGEEEGKEGTADDAGRRRMAAKKRRKEKKRRDRETGKGGGH